MIYLYLTKLEWEVVTVAYRVVEEFAEHKFIESVLI